MPRSRIRQGQGGHLIVPLLLLACLMAPADLRAAVTVSTVSALADAVSAANNGGDPVIRVNDGTYMLNGITLRITADGVTVESVNGKRDNVLLDGNYQSSEIFQIVASDVTLRNLTIRRASDHPVHVMATDGHDVTGVVIDNLHIIDPGQQAIKINPDTGRSHTVDYGRVSNCLIELTDAGRAFVWDRNSSCYTGGVDAHLATGWTIEDNEIHGFWCAGGLAEHGIHFWSQSKDTLVQRNRIIDCDRGIGFGLGSSGHSGGIIRNNMIYHPEDHGFSDVGIGLESAPGARVLNNTIFQEQPYPNALEYRFTATTDVFIANNLTNRAITARDGATASLYSNNTSAVARWFVNASAGNLHLAGQENGVTDAGTPLGDVSDDLDRDSRPQGPAVDIGADEFRITTTVSPPSSTTAKGSYLPFSFLLLRSTP